MMPHIICIEEAKYFFFYQEAVKISREEYEGLVDKEELFA